MIGLAVFGLVCAVLPAIIFFLNIPLFRRAPARKAPDLIPVSVLIPARNEENSISLAVASVLANCGVDVEVIVLDDGSEDATAKIVEALSKQDSRVRLVSGPPLLPGWCGKQHACFELAKYATKDLLCFLDADVRLSPDALLGMIQFLRSSGADLVSGFPRQETVTFLEKLLLPLIHFILLGFLPISMMRRSGNPGFAAGCGQLMLAKRSQYFLSGGHAAIRETLHDGIRLPRAFRVAGFRTDIFDATDLASCRMYRSASEVWSGLAKNAVEGIGAPSRIIFFTTVLGAGQILPFLLCGLAAVGLLQGAALPIAVVAVFLSLYPRLVAAVRFRQPFVFALLHPFGVGMLLLLQWYALARYLLRRPSSWKGRAYETGLTGD